jgi:hypothetical protein
MESGELADMSWRIHGLERIITILVEAGGPASAALVQRRQDLQAIYADPKTAPDMKRAISFELALLRGVPG